MRTVLFCVLLAACGGDDDATVDAEPLVQSTLMGQHDNHPFTPAFGFARANGELLFGAQEIGCEDSLESKPRNGNYVGTAAPTLAVGSYADQGYTLVEVNGASIDIHQGTGSVMITSVDAASVGAVLAYSKTIDGGLFSLTGAVTMKRCP